MDFILVAKILVCAFFGICFLQSGIDKITDRKGNLEWLTGHFSKTPFKNLVPLLLLKITLLEIATGLTCLAGIAMLLIEKSSTVAAWGLALAAFTLFVLFSGQRIAKDYPGAASLATYFGVSILGLWLISTP